MKLKNNEFNKKGFTLIELLAVIVILAIIALVATPLIMNVIEKSKKMAFKQSVISGIKATDLLIIDQNIENNIEIQANGKNETKGALNIKLRNNHFISGTFKYISTSNVIRAENVTDGRYCISGELNNLEFKKMEDCNGKFHPIKIEELNATRTTVTVQLDVGANNEIEVTDYFIKLDNGDYKKINNKTYIIEDLITDTEYKITGKIVINKKEILTEELLVRTKGLDSIIVTPDISKPTTSDVNLTVNYPVSEKAVKREYKLNIETDWKEASSDEITVLVKASNITLETKMTYLDTNEVIDASYKVNNIDRVTIGNFTIRKSPDQIISYMAYKSAITKINSNNPETIIEGLDMILIFISFVYTDGGGFNYSEIEENIHTPGQMITLAPDFKFISKENEEYIFEFANSTVPIKLHLTIDQPLEKNKTSIIKFKTPLSSNVIVSKLTIR